MFDHGITNHGTEHCPGQCYKIQHSLCSASMLVWHDLTDCGDAVTKISGNWLDHAAVLTRAAEHQSQTLSEALQRSSLGYSELPEPQIHH